MEIRSRNRKSRKKSSRGSPRTKPVEINPAKVRKQVRMFLRSPELNYLSEDKYNKIVELLKPYSRFVKPNEITSVLAQLEGAKRVIEEEKKKARLNLYTPIVREILKSSGEPLLVHRLEDLLEKVKRAKRVESSKIEKLIQETKENYVKEKKAAIKDLVDITKELSEHEDEELAALAKEINRKITLGSRPSRHELEKLQEMGVLLDPKKREKLEKTVKKVLEIYRP